MRVVTLDAMVDLFFFEAVIEKKEVSSKRGRAGFGRRW